MGNPRVTSPPTIHGHDFNSSHGPASLIGPARAPNRSMARAMPRGNKPITIPNSTSDMFVPPPLPPPRFIDDLAAGSDPGYQWANYIHGDRQGRGRGTVPTTSSLNGNWGGSMDEKDEGDTGAARWASLRPGFQVAGAGSRGREAPEQADEGYQSLPGSSVVNQSVKTLFPFATPTETPGNRGEGCGKAGQRHILTRRFLCQIFLSRRQTGVDETMADNIDTRLHGERPLQHENFAQYSRTYDNKMLSKIGRPRTPSRTSSIVSGEASPTSTVSLPRTGRGPHPLKSLSISEGMRGVAPDAKVKSEPAHSDYSDSPYKIRSPSHLSSATSMTSYGDLRSPKYEYNISSASSGIEGDQPHPRHFSVGDVPLAHRMRKTDSRSLLDEAGQCGLGDRPSGRMQRENLDQPYRKETSGHPAVDLSDETNNSALRQLHLDDRSTHPSFDTPSFSALPPLQDSRMQSTKRKADSPPAGAYHGEKFPNVVGTTNDQYFRSASSHLVPNHPGSPVIRHAQLPQGSISSNSSAGMKNGSLASSTGLSLGASSMTSYSPSGHLSPGGVSPTSEPQQMAQPSQYPAHISMIPTQADPYAHTHQRNPSDAPPAPTTSSRKMSAPAAASRKRSAPGIPGPPHMCRCCLKKPKKFDTLEERLWVVLPCGRNSLTSPCSQHEAEKAYECQYCHNKFKNKNEMERHQNSLHLRRHSWSCASIANKYQAVFHPSTTIPPNTNNPSTQITPSDALSLTDVCGYCGEEFSNEPRDWVMRAAHLTNQHKFGECNQSKKFYRADHFRQHLKHSHSGTPGKWTNMLEQACMREEPPDPLVALAQTQQQAILQSGLQQNLHLGTPAMTIQAAMPPPSSQDQQQSAQGRGVLTANMNMGMGMGMNVDPNYRIAAMGMQAMSGSSLQRDRIDEAPEHGDYQAQAEEQGQDA